MKVYDCVMFFNELDILEMRLNILDRYVDYFVISESTITHSGKSKKLFYNENKERFAKFHHKIIHNIVEDTPVIATDAWVRERFQRDVIVRNLQQCDDEDIIIYSDLDEIPDLSKINIKDFCKDNILYICYQHNFQYYLNIYWMSDWPGTKFCKWNLLKKHTLTNLRDFPNYVKSKNIPIYFINNGWHFSWFGGVDKIKEKLESFGHQEFNNNYIKDNIQNKINNLKDVFCRPEVTIKVVEINKEMHPSYVVDNINKYKQFIFKGSVI